MSPPARLPAANAESRMPAAAAAPSPRATAGKATSSRPNVAPRPPAAAITIRMPAPRSAGSRPGAGARPARARAWREVANNRPPIRLRTAARHGDRGGEDRDQQPGQQRADDVVGLLQHTHQRVGGVASLGVGQGLRPDASQRGTGGGGDRAGQRSEGDQQTLRSGAAPRALARAAGSRQVGLMPSPGAPSRDPAGRRTGCRSAVRVRGCAVAGGPRS